MCMTVSQIAGLLREERPHRALSELRRLAAASPIIATSSEFLTLKLQTMNVLGQDEVIFAQERDEDSDWYQNLMRETQLLQELAIDG